MKKHDYEEFKEQKEIYQKYVIDGGKESWVNVYYDDYMRYLIKECEDEIYYLNGGAYSYSYNIEPHHPYDLDFWIPLPYYEDIYEEYCEKYPQYRNYAKLVACEAFYDDYKNPWNSALRHTSCGYKIKGLLEQYRKAFNEKNIDPTTNGLTDGDGYCF